MKNVFPKSKFQKYKSKPLSLNLLYKLNKYGYFHL